MPFALLFTVILAALVVFQLTLVFGAPIGRFAWGGQHRVLPRRLRIGSTVSVLIYAFMAVVAFDRLGAIDAFPDGFSVVAMWVIFGYLCLGILLNAVSRSKPERYTMTPVVIVLAVLSLLIASGVGTMAHAI
ncbi:hypothetical protein [Microbacterium sp. TWP3-1-2b2]|uniref:hypothetical protein n=1 Tax=Microbacterium sp. TWP3-1-2b2 TaxID=2804651 RepID=UPI003CFA1994